MRPIFLSSALFVLATTSIAQRPATPWLSHADVDAIAMANQRIDAAVASGAIDSPGRIVVVYFTPSDRKPAANYVQRIRRIVDETSNFYLRELKTHGFKDRRMNVLRNTRGDVDVIDVVGAETDGNYGKPDGGKIRTEAIPVLRQRGIDPDASVLLIFCNMMNYDAQQGTISHYSPYYGGGSYLSGTAWQCDSEILDPQRLTDTIPLVDGEYGRITIGRHNSIFIGGVIHELGHALSLPHCRQRNDEAVRGTALMGSGNRTYAQELRGEGLGTFLTQAHALRLAAHPAFNAQVSNLLHDRPTIDWENLSVKATDDNTVGIQGRVISTVPVHGVVVYFDAAGGSDYDATTATAVPGREGDFKLDSGPLRSGSAAQLRLVACHVNGATTHREMSYRVNKTGVPDLSSIRLALELQPMIDALIQQELDVANSELHRIAKDDPALRSIGQTVLDRFAAKRNQNARDERLKSGNVPPSIKSIALSQLQPSTQQVGWLRPAFDRLPTKEVLLSIDGDYFAQGIYAHAPAKHEYEIAGQWQRLTGRCGMQSGRLGKVDFEIFGDARLLWSARGVVDGQSADFDIDVDDIKTLTLLVGDGGNGNGADWGVWIEPELSR